MLPSDPSGGGKIIQSPQIPVGKSRKTWKNILRIEFCSCVRNTIPNRFPMFPSKWFLEHSWIRPRYPFLRFGHKMLGINRSVRCGYNGTGLNHPGQFVASENVSPTQTPTERIFGSLPTKNKISIGTQPPKLTYWGITFLQNEAETQKSKLATASLAPLLMQ